MPALIYIDWQEPYLSKARQFARTWIRSTVKHQGQGWTIQLTWLPQDVVIGEGELLVRETEKTLFRPGETTQLFEGRTLIANLIVLTEPYDNRLHR